MIANTILIKSFSGTGVGSSVRMNHTHYTRSVQAVVDAGDELPKSNT